MTRRAAPRLGRWVAAAVVVGTVTLAAPTVAHADPAGPTDYRSEVTSITPAVGTVEARIVGGDSFVELRVAPGTEVIVLGYQTEPYLWFDVDGTIRENRRSPAAYLNAERYGTEIPAGADPDAPPEWTRVGGGGAWAWHDHRAHRMERFPPLNAARGDQVLDAVVPIVVDGAAIDVHVRSTWMPAPSLLPMAFGLVGGAALALTTWWAARRRSGPSPAAALAASAALVGAAAFAVGGLQFRSLPASTDPRWLWWLAPLTAVVCALGAIVADRDPARRLTVVPAAAAIAGAQLVVWGWERRSGLVRAVLPTEVPFWIDRLVSATAIGAGSVVTVLAVSMLVRAVATPVPATVRT